MPRRDEGEQPVGELLRGDQVGCDGGEVYEGRGQGGGERGGNDGAGGHLVEHVRAFFGVEARVEDGFDGARGHGGWTTW